MSDAAPPTAPRPLTAHERRVLGTLVEKALTTPESYPLSLNALTNGCNQKSNRDPVSDLADDEVETVLERLQRDLFVIKMTGASARVEKYRHDLYTAWAVKKGELAVLAELMLRGPQTEGDLRGRASRMSDFADLDALRDTLRPLVTRGLVVYLTPEGKRGTILTHGLYPPAELAALKTRANDPRAAAEPAPRAAAVAGPDVAEQIEAAVAPLRTRLEAAERTIARLAKELGVEE